MGGRRVRDVRDLEGVRDGPARRRSPAVAMIGAGPSWVVYGVLAMLHPWGDDVAYSEAIGYSLVRDTTLFLAYSLPGSLALILSASGAVAMASRVARGTGAGAGGTLARRLAVAAAVLGAVSLVGVLARFDPLFTAGRVFGTLVLGGAVVVTAWAARRSGAPSAWLVPLAVVGGLGVLLLPLWPLVYAVQWVPEVVGAVVIALFGLGWMDLGRRMWAEPT